MSRGRLFAAVGAAFLVVVAVAFGWDSVRWLRGARTDLAEVDRELRLHEERVVSLVSGAAAATDRLRADARSWSDATGRAARHAAYRVLVGTVRSDLLPRLDVQDSNGRRLADGIAGALNRRDVASRQYDERAAACQAMAETLRGRLAARLLGLERPCVDE